MPTPARGAAAGAVAAVAWIGVEPLMQRAFGTPYSDSQLVGALITRGRLEPVARVGAHAAAGAFFGAVWAAGGGRGVRSGVAAAQLENAALWPAIALVDRFHPKVRGGTRPPLAPNPPAC